MGCIYDVNHSLSGTKGIMVRPQRLVGIELNLSILSRLFLLVAVALLPAVALQASNEFYLRRARQVEVQNQALNLAKLAAAEQ
jgi:hypothetical protein